MRFSEVYGPGKFGLSYEVYPPKTEANETELFRQLNELMTFRPSYVTCTYGAGGSTRGKTLDIVRQVQQQFGCSTAAHLTCVESTKDDLREYLRQAQAAKIENIVALRGDPPQKQASFRPVQGGLQYANELVGLIRAEFPDFGVAVAGYPEVHQESPDAATDLANLVRKVRAGADIVITQLFYQNDDFYRFRDRCQSAGITIPIIPGILPITNLAQIRRITSLCKARLPESLVRDLEANEDSPDGQMAVGVNFATSQVRDLLQQGVPGLHLYVLNRAAAPLRVLRDSGIAPRSNSC